MKQKDSFFETSGWGHLDPGSNLRIDKAVRFISSKASKSLEPLIKKSKKELEREKKESEGKEKKLFSDIQKLGEEWAEQASQTMLLTRAIEYLETRAVAHTKNQWKESEDGSWEISNRVYKMCFKIYKNPEKSEVCLEWSLGYNIPEQPSSHYYTPNHFRNPWGVKIYIVKPEKRSYASVESAQKFIQARFDEYLPLFSEPSPLIPQECKEMFSVNGCLLPYYGVALSEQINPKDIDSLLDCLEDHDAIIQAAPVSSTCAKESTTPNLSPKALEPIPQPALFKPKSVRKNVKKASHKKKRTTPER